jgi:hypothetical protein
MSLDFPASPAINQIYSSPPQQWLWDGSKWTALNSEGSLSLYLPLIGGELTGPGNLIIDGTLNVDGTVTFGGTANLTTLNASGTVTFGGTANLTTLNVSGTTALHAATATALTVTGNVTINNAAWYQGKDTSGNAANLLTMWSDNCCYLSETSRALYLRGSAIHMQGAVDVNSSIQCTTLSPTGSISPINMNSYSWGWGWDGTVHFYVNSGDQGQLWLETNQGGWVFKNVSFRVGDFQSNNNVNAAGQLICGGLTWSNNGGWMYSPNSVQTNGNLQANGGVVYLAGMYWQNNSGYMYTPWSIHTDNAVNIAGATWQINQGWMYTPNSLWTAAQIQLGGPYLYPSNQGGTYCGLTGNSWAACYSYAYPGPSGRSMKTDIADAPEGALTKVNALRVVRFRWREEVRPVSDNAMRLHHGFIADEAVRALGEDFGGYYNWHEAETGAERLDKTEMVCVLWQAVQELAAEVAALKAERR